MKEVQAKLSVDEFEIHSIDMEMSNKDVFLELEHTGKCLVGYDLDGLIVSIKVVCNCDIGLRIVAK